MNEYVLGLNEGICSSAALSKNGEIIAAASEERFTRIKNNWGYPKNAINYCLEYANIDSQELSKVVLSYIDPYVHFTKGRRAEERKEVSPQILKKLNSYSPSIEYKYPYFNIITDLVRKFYYMTYHPRNQKIQVEEIAKSLNIDKSVITRVDHHLCHATSAYFSNNTITGKQLIFTNDGAGDFLSSSIFIASKGKIKRIASTPHVYSLGLLYSAVTGYLGMKAHEDEYKVMGLAPYADELVSEKLLPILQKLIWVDGLTFKSSIPSRQYGKYLEQHFHNNRFDTIAWAVQKHFENLITQWIKNGIKRTKINNIVCSGGSFLNVKANKMIINLSEVKSAYFMPSPGDETNAIGAAYYGSSIRKNGLTTLYLGPSYSDNEIANILKKNKKIRYKKYSNIEMKIAKLLSQGEIVAHFSGRMEFGARALGNRSILANPYDNETKEHINKMIKMRDFWMPFAPAILDIDMNKYIINKKNIFSPYMIIGFETTEKAKKDLKAAIHPYDKTARPQVVSEKMNSKLYKIIKEFRKITKIGGVLNTSFNIHGEPIVCSPQDAIYTLLQSGLEYLVIENYLITKFK